MSMDNLERRALLGDRQAQEECARMEILLPCPFCGEKAEAKTQKSQYGISGTIITCGKCFARIYCLDERAQITETGIRNVPVRNHKFLAFLKWNRRPAPLIGRCKDCAHSSPRMVMGNKTYGKVCKIDLYLVHEVNPNGYCDGFKPKEAPND